MDYLISCLPTFRRSRTATSPVGAGVSTNEGGDEDNWNGGCKLQLPNGLLPQLMPKHVGMILDGNRRWAKEIGLAVQLGHRAGATKTKDLVRMCSNWGIKVLSLFVFSTENWSRPQQEVDFLMKLLEKVIKADLEFYNRIGVQFSVIGDRSKLPASLQETIEAAERSTEGNAGLHLLIALNYSGQSDILRAAKRIAEKVRDGVLEVEDIDNRTFDRELETNCVGEFPNPDLLIRTSGEIRIGNVMLWQTAYTEFYFEKKMFPNFEEADFVEGLRSFQQRQRRFGGHQY